MDELTSHQPGLPATELRHVQYVESNTASRLNKFTAWVSAANPFKLRSGKHTAASSPIASSANGYTIAEPTHDEDEHPAATPLDSIPPQPTATPGKDKRVPALRRPSLADLRRVRSSTASLRASLSRHDLRAAAGRLGKRASAVHLRRRPVDTFPSDKHANAQPVVVVADRSAAAGIEGDDAAVRDKGERTGSSASAADSAVGGVKDVYVPPFTRVACPPTMSAENGVDDGWMHDAGVGEEASSTFRLVREAFVPGRLETVYSESLLVGFDGIIPGPNGVGPEMDVDAVAGDCGRKRKGGNGSEVNPPGDEGAEQETRVGKRLREDIDASPRAPRLREDVDASPRTPLKERTDLGNAQVSKGCAENHHLKATGEKHGADGDPVKRDLGGGVENGIVGHDGARDDDAVAENNYEWPDYVF